MTMMKSKSNAKSNDNTVFVRFSPPSSSIKRWHLEEYFSQIGPIKKCSVIFGKEKENNATGAAGGLGYGFVKFVSPEDAADASRQYNGSVLTVDDKPYKLMVELASQSSGKEQTKKSSTTSTTAATAVAGNLLAREKQSGGNKEKNTTASTTGKVKDKKVGGPISKSDLKSKSPTTESRKMTNKSGSSTTAVAHDTEDDAADDDDGDPSSLAAKRKRTSRVIVRNLSFYATEKDIKKALQKEFGPVCDVHIPFISDKLHRGFCFVTFESERDALKATATRETPLEIKKRPVAIDFALNKTAHEMQQRNNKNASHGDDEEDDDENSSDDDENSSDDDDDDDDGEDANEKSDDDEEDDESEGGDEDQEMNEEEDVDEDEHKKVAPEHDEAVSEQKTVFIRNLPFDTTRHDLFETMRRFGHIVSIHMTMDRETGVFKGTAFCEFKNSEQASRALEAASSNNTFTELKHSREASNSDLMLRGRRLLLDLAVDKKTASTLTMEKKDGETKLSGKDKRCLYLKDEGYIQKTPEGATTNPDPNAWENIPESDQLKRFRALSEKTTKLKSPLFFINPKRLSIRNLAKHVDEVQLKKLCVTATLRGLSKVRDEDLVAYWRASGTMTTREIVLKLKEAQETKASILPTFSESNVKKYIPSVFIDRDFGTKDTKGVSRGFGFVDFEHHTHAIACLRELNNNPKYTAEFVAGGKRATDAKKSKSVKRKKIDVNKDAGLVSEDGRVLVPRLIVEFTVENKAKAQQQAANRIKQQANVEKQRIEKMDRAAKKKAKKQSRGALQREKKRKRREEGADTSEKVQQTVQEKEVVKPPKIEKVKSAKPPKKQKVDKEEQSFANMVQSYTEKFQSTSEKTTDSEQSRKQVREKRWFE